jgi:hypothetical protein
MATRFAQQFKRTGVPNILRQFGETAVYFSGGIGAGREITVTVVRDSLAIIAEIGEVLTQAMIVRVTNDAVLGMLVTDIDTGRDRIRLPLEADGVPEIRSVVRVLSDVNGFVRLLVQ